MRLLQGDLFYTPGETSDEFWDTEADEKFEVTDKMVFQEWRNTCTVLRGKGELHLLLCDMKGTCKTQCIDMW